MFDSRTVLSLSSVFGKKKDAMDHLVPAFLTQEWDPWGLGSPIIIDSRYEGYRGGISALALMNSSQRTGGAAAHLNPDARSVRLFGDPKLIANHKVMEVSFFDPSKVKRLLEYIYDVGSVSFVIVSEVGQRSLANDIGKYLINQFEYNVLSYQNSWLSMKYLAGGEDMKLGLVNLFDLQYCMPIFNRRRADGIGISLNIITKQATIDYDAPHRIAQLDVLTNNYPDNLFMVDGCYVNEPWPYDERTTKEFERAAAAKLKIVDGSAKSPKAPKLRMKRVQAGMMDKEGIGYEAKSIDEWGANELFSNDGLVEISNEPVPEAPPDDPDPAEIKWVSAGNWNGTTSSTTSSNYYYTTSYKLGNNT